MVAKETGLQSRKKQAAYLVAVSGQGLPAAVYAVIAQTPEAALAALQEQSANAHQLEIVGALSRDLARKINLKSGPLKLI